jgi:X-linked retinitis pigmentosa GTPase regulator
LEDDETEKEIDEGSEDERYEYAFQKVADAIISLNIREPGPVSKTDVDRISKKTGINPEEVQTMIDDGAYDVAWAEADEETDEEESEEDLEDSNDVDDSEDSDDLEEVNDEDLEDNEEEEVEDEDESMNQDMNNEYTDASAAVDDYNTNEEDDVEDEDGEYDEEEGDDEKPSTFDSIKIGDKFKLINSEQTFKKLSPKEYTVDNPDPAIQQKNKSVIINPQSKVISVPDTSAIQPENNSPEGNEGESEEPVNAGTQTSQDNKDITSDKNAKQVTEEDKNKEHKQTVDLTGLADKEHITEDDVDPDQLKRGIQIEMEHTKDKDVAKQIALDHLTEIPDYYTRLDRMEREAAQSKNKAKENKKNKQEKSEEPEPEVNDNEDSEEEKDPALDQEKKMNESTLDTLVNGMIISALENIEKEKK